MKNAGWILLVFTLLVLMTWTSEIKPMMPEIVVHSQRHSVELEQDIHLDYYLHNYGPSLSFQLIPYIRRRFEAEKKLNSSDIRDFIREVTAAMRRDAKDSPASMESTFSTELHNYIYEIVSFASQDMVDDQRSKLSILLAKKEVELIKHKEDLDLALRKARLNACTTVATALIASAGTAIVTLIIQQGTC